MSRRTVLDPAAIGKAMPRPNPPGPRLEPVVPISKRLRFEIFRRDNHTCRYCGGTAPNVRLTVDHVLPTALGGTDEPTNLVAACSDCNGGKTSTNPAAPVVAQVSEDAIRWARAVAAAAAGSLSGLDREESYAYTILDQWDAWQSSLSKFRRAELPDDWRTSVEVFRRRGLPVEILQECVRIGLTSTHVATQRRWAYAMGAAWRKLAEIEANAAEIFHKGTADGEQ